MNVSATDRLSYCACITLFLNLYMYYHIAFLSARVAAKRINNERDFRASEIFALKRECIFVFPNVNVIVTLYIYKSLAGK